MSILPIFLGKEIIAISLWLYYINNILLLRASYYSKNTKDPSILSPRLYLSNSYRIRGRLLISSIKVS